MILGIYNTEEKREAEDDEVSTPEKFYTINEVRQVKAKKKRVGKYSLDGYHEESNTAYEFQGCLWHSK